MTHNVNKEGKITKEIDEKGKSIPSDIFAKKRHRRMMVEVNQYAVESLMVINTCRVAIEGKSIHSRIVDEYQHAVQPPVIK